MPYNQILIMKSRKIDAGDPLLDALSKLPGNAEVVFIGDWNRGNGYKVIYKVPVETDEGVAKCAHLRTYRGPSREWRCDDCGKTTPANVGHDGCIHKCVTSDDLNEWCCDCEATRACGKEWPKL